MVAVVGLVGVSWRQVATFGQVTRLVMYGTVVAMVGAVGSGTLLWVWGVLLVAKLAVINSAASVGPFPIVSLWWVWVAVSVVR